MVAIIETKKIGKFLVHFPVSDHHLSRQRIKMSGDSNSAIKESGELVKLDFIQLKQRKSPRNQQAFNKFE